MSALQDEVVAQAEDALDDAVGTVLEVAREASSGRYSQAELDAMYGPRGPYSKADPHPPADPGIINVQTGQFRSAWEEGADFGPLHKTVVNTDPVADFLDHDGTGGSNMMRRPVKQKVEEETVRKDTRLLRS